jgi:enoyl-CoA hydratase/carnithine racemase
VLAVPEFEDIQFTVHEHHAEIVLNRPDRLNAMDFKMIWEINNAATICERTRSIRSVVVRGAGSSFCSGDNLKGMGEPPFEPFDLLSRSRTVGYVTALKSLRDLTKPVIAAVQGHCLGAGLELALCCDIRILSKDARAGIPFVKIGYAGATYLLPRYVGFTRAVEMLLSGRSLSGEEALQAGIATEVVETPSDLEGPIQRWVSLFAEAPKAVSYMKKAVYRAYENDWEAGFELMAMNYVMATLTDDLKEGKKAFVEKRKPRFTGK